MLSKRPHMDRRRMLTSTYSRTHVQNSALLTSLLQSIIGANLHDKLDVWAGLQEVVDVHRMNKALLVDVMTAWLFGREYGTNILQDDADAEQLFGLLKNMSTGFFWRSEFRPIFDALCWMRVWPGASEILRSRQALQRWFSGLCDKAVQASPMQTATSRRDDGRAQEAAFSSLWEGLQDSSPSKQSARAGLEAELLDHLVAGHDVTGIALTYLMYSMSRHPTIQSALRAEINALRQTSATNISMAQRIDALPLLHAIVMETLRLYSPNPGPWPRVVPSSGCSIDGYQYIPAGTVIAASSYVLHRNTRMFPEPEKWKPERWLGADAHQRREMDWWFWAFGSGARVCIGNDLAMRGE
ncbi:MAG: hypothetical protein Q9165_002413 [Trypethelium subeluteriae]